MDVFQTAIVIKAPSQTQDEIKKELTYRKTNKIPPGYKDAGKDDLGVGDLLIWMSILEIGKTRKKPLLFVTGEEKSDWFYRSDNRGMLPRYELIDEFRRDSSGHAFYLASFSGFLEIFGAPQDLVSAVRRQEVQAESESSASVNFSLLKETDFLFKLASEEPRAAILKSWELLAIYILQATHVLTQSIEPDSPAIAHSILKLRSSTTYTDETVLEIITLRSIATKVFNHSKWAYDPSEVEARDFILRCEAVKGQLGTG